MTMRSAPSWIAVARISFAGSGPCLTMSRVFERRVRAAHAVAQAVELLSLGVLVERRIGGKAQFLGIRRPGHPDVEDQQLRAAGGGDMHGFVEGPLGGRREVGRNQDSAEHHTGTGVHGSRKRPIVSQVR